MSKHLMYLVLIVVFISQQSSVFISSLKDEKGKKQKYIIYLHGRIIEEKGIHAVHEEYGAYDYEGIVNTLMKKGFDVISEVRPLNTKDSYSDHVVMQVDSLLAMGVPDSNISIIGASKGGYLAQLVSNKLKNEKIKFVIIASCSKNSNIPLYGKILSIYDSADKLASSCAGIPSSSAIKEIVTNLNVGHGLVYKPYKEWIDPAVAFCK